MEPGYGGLRSTATSAWIIARSGTDYAPADLTSAWYGELGAAEARRVLGEDAEASAQIEQIEQIVQSLGAARPLMPTAAPQLSEGGGENLVWFIETMPRDPDAMTDWIRDRLGPDLAGWEEGKIGWMLIGLLSFNVGDPGWRASMYRALSALPGSTVGQDHEGKRTVTFDSHLGASQGFQTSLRRFTVTIEMATGIVREITSTSEVGEGMVPSEIPDSRMTFEMSVVESLP